MMNSSHSLLVGSMLASHIKKCRKNQFLKSALAVIICESNLPTIAKNMVSTVRSLEVTNCLFMNEEDNKANPIRFDQPGTELIYISISMLLNTRCNYNN